MENSEDFEFIKSSLKTCLPSVAEETLHQWTQSMMTEGITKSLAKFVEKEDLVNHGLDKYQARALAGFWSSTALQPSQIENLDRNLEPREASSVTLNWEKIYNVSRLYKGQMYSARTCILTKKQRPHPKLRERIVSEVVAQVKTKLKSEVTRKSFDSVYEAMISKHPLSFTETLGKGTECAGGLLHQLKTAFDNSNRVDRNTHLRAPEDVRRSYEQPRGKFSYLCVKWRVMDFPEGETPDSIKGQQISLQEIFKTTRPKYWNYEQIKQTMTICYKAQRDLINKNVEDALAQEREKKAKKRARKDKENIPDEDDPECTEPVKILDVYREWPFLFTFEGMHHHFVELTNVNLVEQLDKFVSEKEQDAHMKFFESLSDQNSYVKIINQLKKAQEKHPESDSTESVLKAIILMLTMYFGEEGFMEIVPDTADMAGLDEQKKGPSYPGLLVPMKRQNFFKAKKYFLGVDSELYYSFTCFRKAFLCVFMLYYIFNLNYAPCQQVTLEYIQRSIFHMDPIMGHKRPTRPTNRADVVEGAAYSTKVVHPNVSRLHKKVHSYLPANEDETDDSPDSSFGTRTSDEEEGRAAD